MGKGVKRSVADVCASGNAKQPGWYQPGGTSLGAIKPHSMVACKRHSACLLLHLECIARAAAKCFTLVTQCGLRRLGVLHGFISTLHRCCTAGAQIGLLLTFTGPCLLRCQQGSLGWGFPSYDDTADGPYPEAAIAAGCDGLRIRLHVCAGIERTCHCDMQHSLMAMHHTCRLLHTLCKDGNGYVALAMGWCFMVSAPCNMRSITG